MASVIRLLPKRKVDRRCVPYIGLLDNVMKKRFHQAALLLTYANIVTALFLAFVFPRTVSVRRSLALLAASISILIMQKVTLRTERIAYPSMFAELVGKFTSPSSYVALSAFWLSGYLFSVGALSPRLRSYRVESAEPQTHLQGIPETLAIHKTINWYVINENFLYYLTLIVTLCCVASVQFLASDSNVLTLRPEENGMEPSTRLRNRLRRCGWPAIMQWAISTAITNVVYFPLRQRFARITARLFISRRVGETVLLSGFKPSYLLLPVYAIALVLTWQAVREIFGAYMSLGPLFRGKPISDSAPFDKNGSLIDGLGRNPGQLCALTAWHEVLVIAEHDPRRRKSIYSDVDGDRVIWEDIHAAFTKLIDDQIKVLTPAKEHSKNAKSSAAGTRGNPKEGFPSATHGNALTNTQAILQHPASAAPGANDQHVKVHGTTPTNLYKPETAFEKKIAKFTRSLESRSDTKAQVARKELLKLQHRLITGIEMTKLLFLKTRFGAIFRRSVDRHLALQLRHSQTTAFALRGIARMITKSAAEDELGYVQGKIMPTLVSIDSLAALLEKSISHPTVHSSDVFVKEGKESPNLTRAIRLAGEANGAFAEILEVFQPYLDNLGATPAARKRAKQISAGEVNLEKTAWLST